MARPNPARQRTYPGRVITIHPVTFDDPVARAMWHDQQRELLARYGDDDAEADFAAHMADADLIVSLVATDADGNAIGTALVRWSPYNTGPGAAEVKRLYVRPSHRGHGHSRVLMGAIEAAAVRAGATRLVLETGTEQPEALALYDRIGYARIPGFGPYLNDPRSISFAKALPHRALIVVQARRVALAAFEALAASRARVAFVDADALGLSSPSLSSRDEVALAEREVLAFAAQSFRRRGLGLVVVAAERADARDEYVRVFRSHAGPGDVTIAVPASAIDEIDADVAIDGVEGGDGAEDAAERAAAELLAAAGW